MLEFAVAVCVPFMRNCFSFKCGPFSRVMFPVILVVAGRPRVHFVGEELGVDTSVECRRWVEEEDSEEEEEREETAFREEGMQQAKRRKSPMFGTWLGVRAPFGVCYRALWLKCVVTSRVTSSSSLDWTPAKEVKGRNDRPVCLL